MAAEVGFGHLVVVADGRPMSTPLPFLIEDGAVIGHLSRPNPVAKCDGAPALLIVPGLDGYISPSWYPSKAKHGRVVPTWNYEVVHAHGTLTVHDNTAWVTSLVDRLTNHHESGRETPWSIDDAPEGFIEKQARAIVGIEITVDEWVGKRKLSQNRTPEDRAGAIAALSDQDPARDHLASAMRQASADDRSSGER